MAFSKVSSMLVFLLLVLVFPHMNKCSTANLVCFGAEETEHPDQLVTVQRRVLRFGFFQGWCIKNCKKGSDFLGSLPKPPSPPPRFPKGRLPPPPRFSKGKNV
ncbi:unnamed protein product [Brassica oleracea]